MWVYILTKSNEKEDDMSHKNKICLKMQSKQVFDQLVCFGRSKYEDKKAAADEYDRLPLEQRTGTKQEYINSKIRDKIYSHGTYGDYVKHINYFLKYCEDTYRCKTLKQCRDYVDEWLTLRMGQGLSAYTIKLEAAALGKLYQESTENFIPTPDRKRADITRSRNYAKRDYGFSLDKNKEIIDFCRGTGLRRSELTALTGDQLILCDGNAYIAVKGKGGRYREAPIIGPNRDRIIDRMQRAGHNKVWESIPSHMDVHEYRSEYATAIYIAYAREEIPKEDRYCCKADRKGTVMDKQAMRMASQALGHSRINVVAGHYIR